jgi:hypothetical protein
VVCRERYSFLNLEEFLSRASMPIVVGVLESPPHILLTFYNSLLRHCYQCSSSFHHLHWAATDSFDTLDSYHRRCKIFYTKRRGSQDEDLIFSNSLVTLRVLFLGGRLRSIVHDGMVCLMQFPLKLRVVLETGNSAMHTSCRAP